MLVTDAMPPVGGSRPTFRLTGQLITVRDGVCRGPDGTLAGSALTMSQAFRNAIHMLECSISAASRMASGNPAAFLGIEKRTGSIMIGLQADLVHLDENLHVQRTWIGGVLDSSEERC
jgi:N-acetylglucosamine-6-phosphate deacetylase